MNNVTNIAKKRGRKLRLPRLESEIEQLYEIQRKAEWDIGLKLLEMKDSEEWKHEPYNYTFFDAYLENWCERMEQTNFGIRYLKTRLSTAEFGRAIETGKAPKKYLAFFSRQGRATQERMSQVAKRLMNESATPISESAAFSIAIREGHFGDPDEITKPGVVVTQRSVEDRAFDRKLRRHRVDPETIERHFVWSLDHLFEEIDDYEWEHKNFLGAIQGGNFRHSARRLARLLNECLAIKSKRR